MSLFSFFNRSQISQGQGNKEVTANDAIEALCKAAGYSTKSVAAGGTINLSQVESEYGVLKLTGAPGSTVTVVKATGSTSPTLFYNATTGGQTIQVKMSGGSVFTVALNRWLLLLDSTTAFELYDKSGIDALILLHPTPYVFNVVTQTWTNQPLAVTELFGLNDRRRKAVLTGKTQVRLIANVETAGLSGAKLRGQYSTDESSWAALENAGNGPEISLTSTGTQVSSWVNLAAGALADVWLRIIGLNGDGAADPDLGLIELQFR